MPGYIGGAGDCISDEEVSEVLAMGGIRYSEEDLDSLDDDFDFGDVGRIADDSSSPYTGLFDEEDELAEQEDDELADIMAQLDDTDLDVLS